jgi:putative transcriptional regulator
MGKKKSHVLNSLRALREGSDNMTQQALAEQVGVARQTIIAIEQGRFCPSLETALRLSLVFGKTVNEIFELENDDPE